MFDDDDLWIRMWRTGLDFTFTDEISGSICTTTARCSPRRRPAAYRQESGVYGPQTRYFQPWSQTARLETRLPGVTTWGHP